MTMTAPGETTPVETFANLGLSDLIVETLLEVGYESPTPIQRQTIPLLLEGRDVVGLAQTGTGKTAAFSLPILDRLDPNKNVVQALVLCPTRELAIQVAEAIHLYGKRFGRVKVLPVYGGDSIGMQMKRLAGGIQVVVGTPGRVMDHLRRGTLSLANLSMVVLDEADEMLKMGFQEDIEWILKQAPGERQTALFSATMPREVRRIAERYLKNPVNVEIAQRTMTVPTVEQRYFNVPERQKLDVLTHLLEAEAVVGEAILIFVRTKIGAADLVEKLQARGHAAEAMHGDMNQAQREIVIRRLKEGLVEIVAATDVAARGLDVENIGQVINFDIPNDPESYVHRIGRTARAGRSGKALLFVTPREGRMLREIERYTGQRLSPMRLPSPADVTARRTALFKEKIVNSLEEPGLELFQTVITEIAAETGRDLVEIAAAAARLARHGKPLAATAEPIMNLPPPRDNAGMVRLYLASGSKAGMRPADVVGAIASDADVPGKRIGAIDIFDNYAFVDLPDEYVEKVLGKDGLVTIRGRAVNIRLATVADGPSRRPRGGPPSGGSDRSAQRRTSTGMARKRPDPTKGGSYRASSRGAPGIKKRRERD